MRKTVLLMAALIAGFGTTGVAQTAGPTLKKITAFDLPGPAGKRFDYLTIDQDDHYLISAHLAASQTYVIDLRTNKVVASIKVPHWASDVACGTRYCWVVSEPKSAGGVATRIDPHSNKTVSRSIPNSWVPAAVVVVEGYVWVADPGRAALIRIDPQTLRVSKRVIIPVS